jgi:site-specific recombinase XerC
VGVERRYRDHRTQPQLEETNTVPPTKPSTEAATGLTVREAIPHFDLHLRARGLSPAPRKVYAAAATLFDAYLAGKGMPRVVTTIRREHVEAWLADMRERGASDGALSNRYRSLRQLFRWLEEDDEIPASPMAKMTTPKVVVQPPPVLTAEQFSRLHKLKTAPALARRSVTVARATLTARRARAAGGRGDR